MANRIKVRKVAQIALAIALLIGSIYTISVYKTSTEDGPWQVGEIPKLDRLALKLSTQFKRSLDQNEFSLFYNAKPPETIVLEVRYRKKMDLALLRQIIGAAEKNAKEVARHEFGLSILTQVDMQPLKEDE